jgi:hypothetical protein
MIFNQVRGTRLGGHQAVWEDSNRKEEVSKTVGYYLCNKNSGRC